MKLSTILLSLICLVGFTSCGHSDSYVVDGTITDGSTQNLRVVCQSADRITTSITAALEGKFRFENPLHETSLVQVYDNDYRLMTRFIAKPGDDIHLEIDRKNLYLSKIDGNSDSQEWSKFLNENADLLSSRDADRINAKIAEYVGGHPDSRLSEMLMLTEFYVTGHEAEADSLYRLINPDLLETGLSQDFAETITNLAAGINAKVTPITYLTHGNYRRTFNPSDARINLYVLWAEQNGRDSILREVKNLARHENSRRLAILDLGLHQDTIPWSRNVRNDSATWKEGWVAGGTAAKVINELAIPSLPYYIITDSGGTQLWRGNSLTKASSEVITRL